MELRDALLTRDEATKLVKNMKYSNPPLILLYFCGCCD